MLIVSENSALVFQPVGSGHVTGQSCLCQGYLLFPVSASYLQHPSHTRKSRMVLIYEARLTIDQISWLLLTFSSLHKLQQRQNVQCLNA